MKDHDKQKAAPIKAMLSQQKPHSYGLVNVQPMQKIVHGIKHTATLSVLLASLVFAGCVTVQEGGSTPAPNPTKAASAYAALAAQYIKQNNLDAALRNAKKAIKADDNYAPAYNMMAIILQRDGSKTNLEKAESYFKRAIDYQEGYAQAHNNYGVYLTQMNRYREAMKQFEIAGATLGYEGRAAALENLGRTALKASNIPVAEQAFRQALAVDRYSLIAKIELVDILLKRKEYEKAQPIYQDYINYLGGRKQGARSLLQGIFIATAMKDGNEFKRLSSLLQDDYPSSPEAQRFRKLFPSE